MKFEFLNLDHSPCAADDKPARFGFECPRSGAMCSGLMLRNGPFSRTDMAQPAGRTWEWNGDRDKPTFRPSINCRVGGKECWHGFITEGQISG